MASTTTGLSTEVSTFYDKRFLERADLMTVYSVGAIRKEVPSNQGKTISFSRRSPLAAATTALTEATNPSAVDMTSTQVTAALAEYGNYVKAGTFYEMTSIDAGLVEHVDQMAANAALTIDTLIKNELDGGGTAQIANSVALTDLAASDIIDGAEIRQAVATLKKNAAPQFMSNGAQVYKAVIGVDVVHDLRGDSEWLDAYRYTDATNIRNGLIGRLHGVEFFETNNQVIDADAGAGNVDAYSTFVFGEGAYASVFLSGMGNSIFFYKKPGSNDTSNPLDLYATVGWKAVFATKVLNASWLIELKTASSIGANS